MSSHALDQMAWNQSTLGMKLWQGSLGPSLDFELISPVTQKRFAYSELSIQRIHFFRVLEYKVYSKTKNSGTLGLVWLQVCSMFCTLASLH